MDPSPLDPPTPAVLRPATPRWTATTCRRHPNRSARRHPIVRHIVLFVLTFVMTTLVGVDHYYGFQSDFATAPPPHAGAGPATSTGSGTAWPSSASWAPTSSATTWRAAYYGVDASLPYFIPAPLLTGTLGAFIRIRQPIPDKRQLFDIGIAGPIAGFLVAVPGARSSASPVARGRGFRQAAGGLELGEPLLLKAIAYAFWGTIPDGFTLNMHPTAFAAWFGCLATALNLFPIGQLDGGHISYAVLGRRSTLVTYGTIAVSGRAVVRVVVVDRVDGAERRDAVRLRPAASAHLRRGRAARRHAPLAGRASPW